MEFEHNGRSFKAEKLSAMQQFHVYRRVAPLLVPLAAVFGAAARSALAQAKGSSLAPGAIASLFINSPEALQPIVDALAAMPDETAEYVIATCLSAVKMQQANGWFPVWNAQARMPQFQDLGDIGDLLPLVVRVIQENLGRFFNALPTGEPSTPTTA